MKKIGVIGGGASGLCAAIEAARAAREKGGDIAVFLLERNARVGKKLLLTGNGRCNLTNTHLYAKAYNTPRAMAVIRSMEADTRAFFAGFGIPTCADGEGRVYPHSMQASCVVNALRGEAECLGVQMHTETRVRSIRRSGSGFLLNEGDFFHSVILACGGSAYPATGSDGDGMRLLERLGIPCAPPIPALTGLIIADRDFKSLKGVRAKAEVTALIGGRAAACERGEVQFTEYGVSGIAVMQLSRAISRALSGEKRPPVQLILDLAPDMDGEAVARFLQTLCRTHPKMPAADLPAGIVPRALGFYLLKRCAVPIGANTCGAVTAEKAAEIAAQIKALRLEVTGVRGFEQAQITAGGADLRAFDERLMARRMPGLFACGEVLDVDGMCGGYNLEWAFSSGRLCGKSAVHFLTEDRA